MIKKGDKFVCIKDIYEPDEPGKPIAFFKGNMYKVINYDDFDDITCISVEENYYKFTESTGMWFSGKFSIPSVQQHFKRNIYDYFITLAEWRNQQIDSILND
jgi:hypothetical protein